MDSVTQQNAALVEEAAAAAATMQEQSANLVQVVSVFKLDQQAYSAPKAATRKSSPAKKAAQPARLKAETSTASARADTWEEF